MFSYMRKPTSGGTAPDLPSVWAFKRRTPEICDILDIAADFALLNRDSWGDDEAAIPGEHGWASAEPMADE
jgi:hypothetical protein